MASLPPISNNASLSITINFDLEFSLLDNRIRFEIEHGNLSGIKEIFNTSHPKIKKLKKYDLLSWACHNKAPEIANFLYEEGLRASYKEIYDSLAISSDEVCIDLFKYKTHLDDFEINWILVEAIRQERTVFAQDLISSQKLNGFYFDRIVLVNPPLDLLEQIIKNIEPHNIRNVYQCINSEELFLFLLNQGVPWDRYTLEHASKNGYNQAIKELRQKNCPFNENELGIAAKHNHAETVALLIKEKAPHNVHTIPDALESKNPEIVKALMSYGIPLKGCLEKAFNVGDLETIRFVLNLGYKPHKSEFEEFGKNFYSLVEGKTLVRNLAQIPEIGEHCIKYFKYFKGKEQAELLDLIPKYTSKSIDYILEELKLNNNTWGLARINDCISKGATLKKRHLTNALCNFNFDLALQLIKLGCPLSAEHLEALCLYVTKESEKEVLPLCQIFVRHGIKPSLTCLEAASASLCENLVKLLVDHGAPINKFIAYGNTCRFHKDQLEMLTVSLGYVLQMEYLPWHELLHYEVHDLVKNNLYKYIQSCLPFELRNKFSVDDVIPIITYYHILNRWKETTFTKLFPLILKSKEDYQLSLKEAFLAHVPGWDPQNSHGSGRIDYYPHTYKNDSSPLYYHSTFRFNLAVFKEILEFITSSCKGSNELMNTVYSFTILFGNVEEVKQFLEKKSLVLNEDCSIEIPKIGTWDTKTWKEWIFAVPEEESYRKKLLPWASKLETVIFGRLPRANTSDSIEEQCTFYRQAIIELIYYDPLYQHELSDLLSEQKLNSSESNQNLDTFLLEKCRDFLPVDWSRYVRREKINDSGHLPDFSEFLKALVQNRMISQFDLKEMSEILAYKVAPESAEKYMDTAYFVAANGENRSILKTAVKILTIPKEPNLCPEVDFCYEDYHFYKLASNDPLILKIMTIADINLMLKASSFFFYRKFSSNLGFYAVKRDDQVMALAQGSIGPNNDFHLHTQISKDKVKENIIFKVFQEAAKKIIEQNSYINRVLASVNNFPNCKTDECDSFKQRISGKLLNTYHSHVLSKSAVFPPALIQIMQSDLSIRQGQRIKNKKVDESLSVNPVKRNAFFQRHPRAYNFLMKDICNPLIEEGEPRKKIRDRNGELFLTSEAIIKLFRNKYSESPFDLIEVDSFNSELLIQQLKTISIHENKPLAILFNNEGKIFTAYIRKANDHYQCYLFHPQKKFHEYLKEVLRNHFNCIEFIRMKGRLLNDLSNMGTMAYQSLKFYANYGVDIFNQRIKGVHPYLLKLTQDHKPESEAMKAIVSEKTGWTLQEYLTFHTKEYNGKPHNTAAQRKKYKLIHELELLLQAELD